MAKYHLTLDEVAEHAFEVDFEGLPLVQREQVKFEPSTRVKTVADAPSTVVLGSTPVTKPISVTLNGDAVQHFDHLIVGANPRELMGYGLSVPAVGAPTLKILTTMVATAEEAAIYSQEGGMHNTYFQTTVIRVPAPAIPKAHVVAFKPEAENPAKGDVVGYRNETRKTYWLKDKAAIVEEHLTFYQLSDPQLGGPVTEAALKEKFEKFIQNPPAWYPYKAPLEGPLGQIETVFNTPYFNRFTAKGLRKGLPWKLLDLQGLHNTTYTHGSSCFESVLHIYQYLQMLDAKKGSLPLDKTARVAIVGAGPSGLLSAHLLVKKGFTDITIFEKNHNPDEDKPNLYAGMTRTHVVEQKGADKQAVNCEMGTCYLSPSYKPMVDDLKTFFDGTMYADDGSVGNIFPLNQNPDYDPKFRCIITDGQFRPEGPVRLFANLLGEGLTVPAFTHEGVTYIDQPMDFSEYVIMKAMEETCDGPPPGWTNKDDRWKLEADWALKKAACMASIPADLLKYDALHKKYLGHTKPFPANQPSASTMKTLTMTFHDWLDFHNLKSLVGFLQYGYCIQGYGSLTSIPVWYGLMWIQPDTVRQAIYDTLGKIFSKIFHPGSKFHEKGEVFALKKGWGQVWDNMRPVLQANGVKFKWSADIKHIERRGVHGHGVQ